MTEHACILFTELVSYILNTIRLSSHGLPSLLGSSKLLNDFLKFAFIKVHTLCCKFPCGASGEEFTC